MSTTVGDYSAVSLTPGEWSMEVSRSGFQTRTVSEIRIFSGQTRRVHVELQLGGAAEEVHVAGRISEVDPVSAAVTGRMEGFQLQSLPLSGRNWTQLLTQMPGAVDPGSSDQRSVRFAGHGRDDTSFELDGVDAGGISNQPQRSTIRIAIPLSTITDFRTDTANFTADAGTSAGAQILLVSAGGGKASHGDVFHAFRNDVFDARNPFASTKPPFRLNQFGGDAGGPIRRNKTFVFAAFEGYRQRLSQPLQGFVPSAAFRTEAIQLSPPIAPLINAYPTGGTRSDANTDFFSGLSSQRVEENSGMIRFDQHFNSVLTGFLRVNADEAVSDVPFGNLVDRQVVDARPLNAVASLTHVISPTILNEVRLGWNQVFVRTVNQTQTPYTLRVAGFSTLNSSRTRAEDDTSASAIDNLSIIRGRHVWKLGFQVRRIHMNPASSADGSLTYTSRENFSANQLDSATVTGVLPMKRLRKTQTFAFVQDQIRVTQDLTLNLGVRYSRFGVFSETEGRAVPFDLYTCGGFCPAGAEFSAPRNNDVDPRVSIAWAPAALGGKTVFRSGFGLYHGDGQLEDQNLPASNDVPR